MRILALSAAALLASATAALAAPASVTVAVAPELQKTFEKTYGVHEEEAINADRRRARGRAADGGFASLGREDTRPRRGARRRADRAYAHRCETQPAHVQTT